MFYTISAALTLFTQSYIFRNCKVIGANLWLALQKTIPYFEMDLQD